MCSEKCGITINGKSNNERWRRERKKNRLSKRTEQNNTQREETTKKNEKRKKCIHQPWLLLLFQLQLTYVIVFILFIFLFFFDSRLICYLLERFVFDFSKWLKQHQSSGRGFCWLCVVVLSKVQKTSSRSSFRFELGITSYVRFLWFWILKDGFPRDLESNLNWRKKTTNTFSP